MVGKKKAGKKDTPASENQKSAQDSKHTPDKKSEDKSGPNTGPIYYLSNKTVADACKEETKKIINACDEDKAASQKKAKASQTSNAKLGKLTEDVKKGLASAETNVKKIYDYKRHDDNAWIEDHCDGLWIKPSKQAKGFDEFTGSIKKIKEDLELKLDQELKDAGEKLAKMAKEKAVDYGKKTVARGGVALASLAVPGAGEVIALGTTVWTVVDGIWTAGNVVVTAVGVGKDALAEYQKYKPQLKTLADLLDDTDKDKIKPSTVLAEMMQAAAKANPCIQARRCILVPFEETETSLPIGAGAVQAKSGKGCCPGQTGHHVLPGAMFRNETKDPCNYNHNKALVICTEGAGNRVGSHGDAHRALDESMKAYKKTAL